MRAQGVGALGIHATHAIAPAVSTRMCHVVWNHGESKLVVRGWIDRPAIAKELGPAVPLEQVGARVARERCTVATQTIEVADTCVPIRGLADAIHLPVKDALAIGTREHTKGACIANVAVNLAGTSIAFDARRPTETIEADGRASAPAVFCARLSVLGGQGIVIFRLGTEPGAADAHDVDKTSLGPCICVRRLRIEALVVSRKTRLLKPDSPLNATALLATRGGDVVAVLVVRNLVQCNAAGLVACVLAVGVCGP